MRVSFEDQRLREVQGAGELYLTSMLALKIPGAIWSQHCLGAGNDNIGSHLCLARWLWREGHA